MGGVPEPMDLKKARLVEVLAGVESELNFGDFLQNLKDCNYEGRAASPTD
jgi:hypothetical protein